MILNVREGTGEQGQTGTLKEGKTKSGDGGDLGQVWVLGEELRFIRRHVGVQRGRGCAMTPTGACKGREGLSLTLTVGLAGEDGQRSWEVGWRGLAALHDCDAPLAPQSCRCWKRSPRPRRLPP